LQLRHEVIRTIAHAQPLDSTVTSVVETELTRAAAGSVNNASQIMSAENFEETDFQPKFKEETEEARLRTQRKKARKAERQRKKKPLNKKRRK
jgi:hypothetical protein